MAAPVTIYDAQSMGVLIGPEAGVPFAAVIVAGLFSVIALTLARERTSEDYITRFAPAAAAVLILMLAIGASAYTLFQGWKWSQDLAMGRFEKLSGCVRDFTESVNPDHDIGTDTFTLDGRQFEINDNVWQLGYHTSHHHGSPIGPDSRLLVYAVGSRMLRIELLPDVC